MDLDGSTGNAGKMTSSNIFLAPENYVLSFYLGGSTTGDTNSVDVSVAVGLLATPTFTLASSEPLQQYNLGFTVGSGQNANSIFDALGGDNMGLILDQVSLNSLTNGMAVPEPSTLFLLGSGLLGLVGYGRRRMRK